MAQDPYQVLGLERNAGPDDIKRAYRTLARKLHPDLNPGDATAEARFKDVNAANDLLSDPDRRGRFDRGEIDADGQERGPPPRPGPGPEYGGAPGSGTGTWRNHAEGMDGARYRRRPAGAASSGTGDADAGFGADGFEDLFAEFRRQEEARASAPRRGADAEYALTVDFGDAVRGATRRLTLPDGRTLDVRIPPGIESGQVLRLRGRGGAGRNGGPDGDALIEVVVAPHPVFTRDGNAIRLELPVTVREAVLGERVQVPVPGGEVAMRLPEGADTGTVLRLRGKGIAAHGGMEAGDVLVTLRVQVGPRDTRLAALLRDWIPENGHPDPRAELMARAGRTGEAA
ncbi:MAG: DnaJ domain-containing protein [Gluconacetobacter diazotrophicus]|nr:DnaJ domain-containing protein [Gluconacetobacter diazotrophicus]